MPILLGAAAAVILIGIVFFITKADGGSLPANRTGSTGDTQITAATGENQPGDTTAPAESQPEAGETTVPLTTVPLPYDFEKGSLEITSLFQYSGYNPDCGWTEGADMGAVVLTNKSEKYLETLSLTVTMTDGVVLSFRIADIPAGKTVWAFDTDNRTYDSAAAVTDVQYEAVFREDTGLAPETVTVSADAMAITLTNISGQSLENLEVRCHGVLDDGYFGGMSYSYPVETLPAGESTVVLAEDCVLGEAEAALVDYASGFVN